jgi:hypothetical protein
MLVLGVAQIDAHTPFAGRPQNSRPRRSVRAVVAGELAPPAEEDAEDSIDLLDAESEQGMTLAAAQAAYASS